MIAIILISRRVSEYFDLNQKNLRRSNREKRQNCANLARIVSLYRSQTIRPKLVSHRKAPATPAGAGRCVKRQKRSARWLRHQS
jgi:hypothetical protein